jgi:hypothetical protein
MTQVTWLDETDEAEFSDCQARLEDHIPVLEAQAHEEMTSGRAEREFKLDQMRPRRELAERANERAIARI